MGRKLAEGHRVRVRVEREKSVDESKDVPVFLSPKSPLEQSVSHLRTYMISHVVKQSVSKARFSVTGQQAMRTPSAVLSQRLLLRSPVSVRASSEKEIIVTSLAGVPTAARVGDTRVT